MWNKFELRFLHALIIFLSFIVLFSLGRLCYFPFYSYLFFIIGPILFLDWNRDFVIAREPHKTQLTVCRPDRERRSPTGRMGGSRERRIMQSSVRTINFTAEFSHPFPSLSSLMHKILMSLRYF